MVNIQRFFSKFPVIKLDNLVLRDLMLNDKNEYYEMMADPEVTKYLSDEDIPTTVTAAEEEIKFWGGLFYRRQSIFWAITDTESNKLIGTIGFNNWNFQNRRAEISYDLIKSHWGKGIMTKVVSNIMLFAFKEMDLYRIEGRTMVDNLVSQKLLNKVGFKLEGVQKGYRIIRGEPADIALYGITRKEYSGFIA